MTDVVPPHLNQYVFVVKMRPNPKPGAVKFWVDIRYQGVTIKGFSIVQYNGSEFVGLPSTVGRNGKRNYVVEFSEPEWSQIKKLILDAKEAFVT
jgi:hypothetical protein